MYFWWIIPLDPNHCYLCFLCTHQNILWIKINMSVSAGHTYSSRLTTWCSTDEMILFYGLRSTKRILGKERKGEQTDVNSALYLWPLTSWRLCTGRWWVCQFAGHARWHAWAIEPAQRKREEIEEKGERCCHYMLLTRLILNYTNCGLGLHGWFMCNMVCSFCPSRVSMLFTDCVTLVCKEAVEE